MRGAIEDPFTHCEGHGDQQLHEEEGSPGDVNASFEPIDITAARGQEQLVLNALSIGLPEAVNTTREAHG